MVLYLRRLYHYNNHADSFIYIPGKLDFSVLVMCTNNTLWPDGRIRLFSHRVILSWPIWRYWTLKMFVRHILFYAIYEAVCIQLTHFSNGNCENTCTLSYYHHHIGSMTYLSLFRVRSWNNGLRCVSLCILMLISFTEVTCNISLFSPHLFVTVRYLFQESNDIVWNKWNMSVDEKHKATKLFQEDKHYKSDYTTYYFSH